MLPRDLESSASVAEKPPPNPHFGMSEKIKEYLPWKGDEKRREAFIFYVEVH